MSAQHYAWWREASLVDSMRAFLDSGLVISPWLYKDEHTLRLDLQTFASLNKFALDFAQEHWTPEAKFTAFHDLPVPDRMTRTALYEIAASSTLSLAWNEGSRVVSLAHSQSVVDLISSFCKQHGLARLVQLYSLATAYENYQAVGYYQPMKVRDYVVGHLHRPWVDYSLMDELEINLHGNHYRKELQDGEEVLFITDRGIEVRDEICQVLTESGYMKVRTRQLMITNFDRFSTFRKVFDRMTKSWVDQRIDFLKQHSVKPGMHVLEIGCADGVLTFDAGLSELVGPTGTLIAIDPAPGMLERARNRAHELGHHWVHYEQAKAEALPFPDDTFDIVTGVAFLQFTDADQALREMTRVAKPGGLVSSFHPVSFQKHLPIFFRDWFASLFELAHSQGYAQVRDTLPDEAAITKYAVQAGLTILHDDLVYTETHYEDPQESVDVMVNGVGWGYIELSELPWQARQSFIDDLAVRGQEICARYPSEERNVLFPQQVIIGIKGA
ncbi:MAG: class I SAM-dependent methyltransferase [Firmicutes bacterium]|nr:class I SAM-dependent methyltransferase [Bacillota bacterium]